MIHSVAYYDPPERTLADLAATQLARLAAIPGLHGNFGWLRFEPTSQRERTLQSSYTRRERPSRARRVICVETGTPYPSITLAANSVGVNQSSVSKAIARGGQAGGFHWRLA